MRRLVTQRLMQVARARRLAEKLLVALRDEWRQGCPNNHQTQCDPDNDDVRPHHAFSCLDGCLRIQTEGRSD